MAQQIVDILASGISLDLPDDLPFDQWRELGAQLGSARTRLSWLIGDWWIFGWHRYGERKQQVETWGALTFQACEDIAWVARQFETSRRREALSFKHHREVASLDPAEADALLDWCLEGVAEGNRDRRSTRELRDEVSRRNLAKRRSSVRFDTVVTDLRIDVPPMTSRVVELLPRRPVPVCPPIVLDQSTGGGPAPTELAELRMEPAPAFDRVAVARAALQALTRDERLALFREFIEFVGHDPRTDTAA